MKVIIIKPDIDIGDIDKERDSARKKFILKEFGEDASITTYKAAEYQHPETFMFTSVLNDVSVADCVYFAYGEEVDCSAISIKFTSIILNICRYTSKDHYVEYYRHGKLIAHARKYCVLGD